MIARTWHGAVPAEKSLEYLKLLRTVGLGDYKKTPGNISAFVLRRMDGEVANFLLLSFWDSRESIKAYAGDDIDVPRYAPFDPQYLISLEPTVLHHRVLEDESFPVALAEFTIARIWHGAVPIGKSDSYLHLMRTVALDDYRTIPGNRGAFVLHRISDDVAHFSMLTFWDSRDAIRAFAGDDIEIAKYYDFDLEYLIEMEPTVLHYEVFESQT